MKLDLPSISYYWLPFPGMYQCVISVDGEDVAEGMGSTEEAAKAAAEANT